MGRVETQRWSLGRDLVEVEQNLHVLVEAELETQHVLLPHEPPVPECPTCRRHDTDR